MTKLEERGTLHPGGVLLLHGEVDSLVPARMCVKPYGQWLSEYAFELY